MNGLFQYGVAHSYLDEVAFMLFICILSRFISL